MRNGQGGGGEAGGFPALAARIRQARLEAGLTQEEAARSIGVIQATWSHWERGRHAPARSARELADICRLLGVDPGWLLGLTDVRRPWPPPPDSGQGAAAAQVASTPPRPASVAVPERALADLDRALREAERALAAARAALPGSSGEP